MKSKKWGEKVNFLFLELIYFQESFDYMLCSNRQFIFDLIQMKSRSADCIVLLNNIDDSINKVFYEMNRILKNKGEIIMVLPNIILPNKIFYKTPFRKNFTFGIHNILFFNKIEDLSIKEIKGIVYNYDNNGIIKSVISKYIPAFFIVRMVKKNNTIDLLAHSNINNQ